MARLRISIVFESGARIGPGKAKLLESIRDTGSISAAARDMGMSYKRAWLLLDSINQAFTEPVPRRALAAHRNPRRAPRGDDREIRFAEDSLLEGDGFEPSVPREETTLARQPAATGIPFGRKWSVSTTLIQPGVGV